MSSPLEVSSEMYLTCDEELDFWRKIGDAPDAIPDVIVPIGKYVYLFVTWDNVVLRYDLLDDSLIPLTGIVNRICYCIVELHKKIYALGGQTETFEDINTVECYDPDSEEWNRVRSVGTMIIGDAVAMCGKIYALGHTQILHHLGDTDNLFDLLDTGNLDDILDNDDVVVVLDTDNLEDLPDIDNLEYELVTDNLNDLLETNKRVVLLDPDILDDLRDIDNLEDELNADNLEGELDTDNLEDELDTDNLEHLLDIDNPDDLRDTDNPLARMCMRVYDPINDTWNTVESPRVFRRTFSAVVFENRLYLIGAENNSLSVRCAEEYDPVLDVWTRLPDLPFLYLRPKARVVAGRLIVFDNYHEENYHEDRCPVSSAVCWDSVTRAWKITDKSFTFYNGVERYRFGILDDPATVRELVSRSRRSAVQWDRISLSE